MNCPKCDLTVPADAVFCPSCGAKVSADTAADKLRGKSLEARSSANDAEISLWHGGFSPKAMIGSWILAALVTVVAIAASMFANYGGAGVFVAIMVSLAIWAGLGLQLLYRRYAVEYELTNQRLVHKRGILRRVTNRIETIDIDDVQVEQGFVERMFGVGTIKILSSDVSDPMLIIAGIDGVKEVGKMIDDARRQERRKRGVHIETS